MDNPLVTVAVVSYKAAEYVAETLDSIKSQTYKNIELIVADDNSPDETAAVCEKWLKENGERFVRTELIASKKNGGVVVNSNRALNATHGEWFKIIGSDDVLLPDAIEKMVNFAQKHQEASFMFGDQIYFNDRLDNRNSYRLGVCELKATCFRDAVRAKDQYNILTKVFFGCAAASIGKTDVIRSIGGFDERWAVEDWPLYINLTKNGYKIYYIDDTLVYRRIISTSIMNQKEDYALLRNHAVKDACGGLGYLYENANCIWKFFYKLTQELNYRIVTSGNDRRLWKCRFWHFMAKWLDAYNYYYAYIHIKEKLLRLF